MENRNELIKAGFTLLILMNIANVLNYLFHFIMGRMLGPIEYGTLAVLTSIIYIFSVPTSAIQTLVSRHTTRYAIKNENGKIRGLLKIISFEALSLAFVGFIIFLGLSWAFAEKIKISFWLLALTGIYLFGAFLSPVGTGILQGLKKFSCWGWNSILNSVIKIILAIILVYSGFGVYGPIIGFIIGVLVSFLFIFPCIKNIIQSKEIKEKIMIISQENIGLITSIFIITLMYSLDIIFAKVFFSPEIAGKYSVASMIGKMIFFGTYSISNAMFPISSERYYNKNQNTKSLILKTFLIIGILCLIAIVGMALFPKLIISVLFGNKYTDIYGIMIYLGIAFSFLSFLNTWILYKISISEFRIRHSFILLLLLVIQVFLFIYFKHDLVLFSKAFMFSSAISFIAGWILTLKK